MESKKDQGENIGQSATVEEMHQTISRGGVPLMRSQEDDLGVWQTVRRYKLLGFIAMSAAFSASLDGYQINLNGGIVSNKGFIRQMADKETSIIKGKYISAWGGIQSAGQAVGQILLQFATERYGRKVALYIIWVTLVVSIFVESFATHWDHWLVAKLFSGMGVGMLQATLPLYLSEISPTQLRGFFINAYTFWFVLGQLFASVALNRLNAITPYDFRTPIYSQWAMVGIIAIIFFFLPESPWWLVSKGRHDKATKVLLLCNGHVPGYNVQEQISIMDATCEMERHSTAEDSKQSIWVVFEGRNLLRFIISGWPKITQQFVGLAVFNTYATYFFQAAGNKDPFLVTLILSSVQLISMILTSTLTDSLGRRPLTVYPYAVTVVSVLCLGIIGCFDYTAKATSSLLILFACLATFSTTGASSIGYAYAAELPQQRVRAQTAAWALAASNLIAIMFSFCTPLMINGSTKWGVKTGFFFAGTGTIAVVIAWFILPEVARRTPAEIDEMFEKRVNLREFKGYVTEVQMRADEEYQGKGDGA
ncbi:general substrate transporter [Thelonectria olida]|uniref:General substrate transporter n=1 Tax=Thelonectria olida TaxID=1576542 RepID=A0A9P9AVU5_9HYPO|nr:general substrate transporter [Thelonectria olida]